MWPQKQQIVGIVRQYIRAGTKAAKWSREGKYDFPQLILFNCCHLLGSRFGLGKPGGGNQVWGQEKAEKPFLERRPLSSQQPVCLDNCNKDNIGTKRSWSSANINVTYVSANLAEGEILGITLEWSCGHFEVLGGSQRASINVPHHHDPHQTSYSYALHPVNPQRHDTQMQNTKIHERQFCLSSFGLKRIWKGERRSCQGRNHIERETAFDRDQSRS